MKRVILRGELGKLFGRVHSFDLNTPAEAIRALCANFEGFQRELTEAGERGIGYMVQIGKDAMASLDEIGNPTGQAEAISITPVLQGAGGGGGGIGKIFAGIALVAAAVVLGPIGAAVGLTGGAVFAAGTGIASAEDGYVSRGKARVDSLPTDPVEQLFLRDLDDRREGKEELAEGERVRRVVATDQGR